MRNKCRVAGAPGGRLLHESGFDAWLPREWRRRPGYPRVRELFLHSRQNSCSNNGTHVAEVALLKLTPAPGGFRLFIQFDARRGPALSGARSLLPPVLSVVNLPAGVYAGDRCKGVRVSCFLFRIIKLYTEDLWTFLYVCYTILRRRHQTETSSAFHFLQVYRFIFH